MEWHFFFARMFYGWCYLFFLSLFYTFLLFSPFLLFLLFRPFFCNKALKSLPKFVNRLLLLFSDFFAHTCSPYVLLFFYSFLFPFSIFILCINSILKSSPRICPVLAQCYGFLYRILFQCWIGDSVAGGAGDRRDDQGGLHPRHHLAAGRHGQVRRWGSALSTKGALKNRILSSKIQFFRTFCSFLCQIVIVTDS